MPPCPPTCHFQRGRARLVVYTTFQGSRKVTNTALENKIELKKIDYNNNKEL